MIVIESNSYMWALLLDYAKQVETPSIRFINVYTEHISSSTWLGEYHTV